MADHPDITPDADEDPPLQLFAKREKVYPKSVSGRFRRLKWLAMAFTLAIYYFAPFLRWDRGPNAPDQAILIDLPHRRAYWFFIEIWPQEVYYLVAILIFAAVALFFVTSLFGRVWCGYFCPQTVWTDLFVKVEQWLQGDRAARIRLDKGPWNFNKIWRKTITHLLWIVIGLATAGAFVFYFNDAPTLWGQILRGEVSSTVLGVMGALTFSTYIMAGFARENVCIYMCPYSRFQSAMFDKDTLVISYEQERGEPRGKHKKGDSWEGRGHCVSCQACVQVCPTGVDIRKGLQIDCIACGLCVDACDDIMDKVGLPRGLIRYDTERNIENRQTAKLRIIRPRSIYYGIILTAVASVVLYAMFTRKPSELHVLHDRNPLFVLQSNGSIRNGYEIKILNKTHDARAYRLSVEGLPGAVMDIRSAQTIQPDHIAVPADSVGDFHLFISAPAQPKAQNDIKFILTDSATGNQDINETRFITSGRE